MTIFADIMKGGASGVFQGIGSLAKDIRTAITGKATLSAEQMKDLQIKAMDLENQILNVEAKLASGQLEINKAEANSASFFRGGWRPSVGWICSFSLLYTFILRPLIPWIVNAFGANVPPLPPVDMQTLMTLLFGMLGLGGFRTFEKIKGLK